MNTIQVLALFLVGALVLTGKVFFFTLLGLPLVGAFLLVTLVDLFLMGGMQRRARECADMQRPELQVSGKGSVLHL